MTVMTTAIMRRWHKTSLLLRLHNQRLMTVGRKAAFGDAKPRMHVLNLLLRRRREEEKRQAAWWRVCWWWLSPPNGPPRPVITHPEKMQCRVFNAGVNFTTAASWWKLRLKVLMDENLLRCFTVRFSQYWGLCYQKMQRSHRCSIWCYYIYKLFIITLLFYFLTYYTGIET